MTKVTLYEDNAGGLYLQAEGGAMVYETIPGLDTPESEMAFVAENPAGDAYDWSQSLQHAEYVMDDEDAVAVWEDGVITVIGRWGSAARAYLDLPSPSDFFDVGMTPKQIRAEFAAREVRYVL